MATYGLGDLAAEATAILEGALGQRAGSSGNLQVHETVWTPGRPGKGCVVIDGLRWTMWDYREEIHMTDELASLLRQPDEGIEKRQCVTKAIAAGVLWRSWARQPSLEEVDLKAQAIRLEQVRQALDAVAVMGTAQMRVAPIEAEIRVYAHDIAHVNHDKDFRPHAVFPVEDLEECRLVVIRADYRGEVVIEMVTGTMWQEGGWLLWTFIWKGHMVLLEPPGDLDVETFLFIGTQMTPLPWASCSFGILAMTRKRQVQVHSAAACVAPAARPGRPKSRWRPGRTQTWQPRPLLVAFVPVPLCPQESSSAGALPLLSGGLRGFRCDDSWLAASGLQMHGAGGGFR